MKRTTRFLGMMLIGATLSGAAGAQDTPFMFQPGVFSNMMMQPNIDRMLENNMRLARGENFAAPAKERGAPAGQTVFRAAGKSRMPELMAGAYPPEARTEAAQTFRQLLEGYHQIEEQFSIPKYDVAGAVAALLAGSYMAYHNVDFPDEHFPPLVAQMRGLIARNPAFAKASAAEKQDMYEQFAIIGMLTSGTQMALKENPGAPGAAQAVRSMREAGKTYLESFLKTDAARVRLTERGLELR